MSQKAFTRRTGSNLPLISFLVENYHHSKYETTSLETALMSAFSDDMYLFGGKRKTGSVASSIKVAVTATSLAGKKTFVLANYNRPMSNQRSGMLSGHH